MKEIKVLITEEEINKRLDEIAEEIMRDYKGKDIMFLCILKGSMFVTVELAKRIRNNIQFEFVEVSSYQNNKNTGIVKLNKDITQSIEGKEVIIIEDIIDTGRTLLFLKELLTEKNPKSLKICSLLDKPSKRIVNVKADYVGFEIDDKFVVGYGLDDEQNNRNLNFIGYIEE